MRKIILVFSAVALLAVSSMPVFAEETESASSKHHLELGAGIFDVQSLVSDRIHAAQPITVTSSMVMDYAASGGYYPFRFGTPVLGASYYYQVLPWLQVGAEAGVGMYNITNIYTDNTRANKLGSYRNTSMYLTAGVRFTFYKTDFVQLYSGLSVGAVLNVESCNGLSGVTNLAPSFAGAGFTFQATALGVRFGKQVYGIAELGCGYKGVLTLGIGTRF